MKAQMVAIAIVSAMLGGVFGVAVWRAVGAEEHNPVVTAEDWRAMKLSEQALRNDIVAERQRVNGFLRAAGVLDEKGELQANWWCDKDELACHRDLESCETTAHMLPREPGKCRPAFHVWCSVSNRAYGDKLGIRCTPMRQGCQPKQGDLDCIRVE